MGDLADYINGCPLFVKAYILNLNGIILNLFMSFVYIIYLVNFSFWNKVTLSSSK